MQNSSENYILILNKKLWLSCAIFNRKNCDDDDKNYSTYDVIVLSIGAIILLSRGCVVKIIYEWKQNISIFIWIKNCLVCQFLI